MTGVTQKIADKPNDRQVGGDHYKTKSGIQHWDLFGPDYLIGYATKYMRWWKKGGVQDLEKAIHVVEKLKEITTEQNRPEYDVQMIAIWCDDAKLDWVERKIVNLIMLYRGHHDLDEAIVGLRHLIETAPKRSSKDGFMRLSPNETMRAMIPTDEEMSSDRRVPRYLQDTADGVAVERTPEDGGQHASLAPWQIDRGTYNGWARGSAVKHETMLKFYKQVTPEIFRLETVVSSRHIAAEIQSCYQVNGNASLWIL